MGRSKNCRLPLPRDISQKEAQTPCEWRVEKSLWFVYENQVEVRAEYRREDSRICLDAITRLLHTACAGVKGKGFFAQRAFEFGSRRKLISETKLKLSKIRRIDQDVEPQGVFRRLFELGTPFVINEERLQVASGSLVQRPSLALTGQQNSRLAARAGRRPRRLPRHRQAGRPARSRDAGPRAPI